MADNFPCLAIKVRQNFLRKCLCGRKNYKNVEYGTVKTVEANNSRILHMNCRKKLLFCANLSELL